MRACHRSTASSVIFRFGRSVSVSELDGSLAGVGIGLSIGFDGLGCFGFAERRAFGSHRSRQ